MSVPLIPREVLFGNPDRASPQISPDGRFIAFLAPDQGVLNLWVAPVEDPHQAKVVTADRLRGIRSYAWAFDGTHLLYVQDEGGDENWHIHAVPAAGGEDRDLTPIDGVQARIVGQSRLHPHHILVGLNDRNPQLHDVWKLDLRTGKMDLVHENPGFLGFLADLDLEIRVALTSTPDGGMAMYVQDGEWTPLAMVPQEDSLTTAPIALDRTGGVLFLVDSRGRDTAAAWAWDLTSGERTLLAEDPQADVSDLLVHPIERNIQAVASTYERTRWQILDDRVAGDLEALDDLADGGEVQILSRTDDDTVWTVAVVADDGPVRYYLWDRASRSATLLFTNRSRLEGLTLARMHAAVIPARDGLPLVSYYSLPADDDHAGRPAGPLPLVLIVHGGPWARDEWGYHPYHQWLANRGYAVLSVNFRGSTGFGKAFVNAGDKQWAGTMHDDLLDAVQWAIDQGIAQADKVAIMGGSYGGYATLVGLSFTPEVFACGVDIVGPSNIQTLIDSIPEYWKPVIAQFDTRVGNPAVDGEDFLWERSPLSRVEAIRRPLLIGQGANDPRVKQAESDQIVEAMQHNGIPVTYVLFPDEGHGFARPENNQAFMGITEAFLAENLGGRSEPLGDTLKPSTVQVPTGAEHVTGLPDALS